MFYVEIHELFEINPIDAFINIKKNCIEFFLNNILNFIFILSPIEK
jgi:hypothetical protein